MKKFVFVLMFATSISSFAGEMRVRTCRSSLLNLIYQSKYKVPDKLEINEMTFNFSPGNVMGDVELKKVPLPLLKDAAAIFRRDGLARQAFKQFNDVKVIKNGPDKDFMNLLKPNIKYTYVIDDEKIRFAIQGPGIIRDYASKHALMRDQSKPLRLAGEMWKDDKGVLHIDGASGTFRPTNTDVERGKKYLKKIGVSKIETHPFMVPAVAGVEGLEPLRTSHYGYSFLLSRTNKVVVFAFSASKNNAPETQAKRIKSLDGKEVILADKNGKKTTYRFARVYSESDKRVIRDTDSFEILRNSGRKISSTEIKPQMEERFTSTEFMAYPVRNGKVDEANPAMKITLNEMNYSALNPKKKSENVDYYDYVVHGNKGTSQQLLSKLGISQD